MKIRVTSSIYDDEFGKDIGNLEDSKREILMSESEIKKIVSVLEESSIFTEAVVSLRNKYNVPAKFYDFKDLKLSSKKNSKISDNLFIEVKELTKQLGIPSYFSLSLWCFILCDLFLIPQRIPLEILYIDKQGFINDKEFLKLILSDHAEDETIFIEIKEQISKERLHNLIDEKWEDIEKGMKLNLYKRPQNKMIRTGIAKRITELRDIQKLHFGEIANVLQKENLDTELYDSLNEDYVKILYYRWKKKINPQSNN
ncbi:MAG: hypothetical protein Q7R51_03315 [bacterium]|nr:hypothetical protein [bacterium]